MLKRKQIRAIQKTFYKLFKKLWKLTLSVGEGIIHWLLRSLLLAERRHRRPAAAKAGFILPTVTMLMLVLALVIAAIIFRTGNRTNQVMVEREQQTIVNAASPAIDRAKAKLEYLFRQDDRRPGGVPSEATLNSMLLNDGKLVRQRPEDPYTFKDEKRISNAQNAWYFEIDSNGDKKPETIAYSINLLTENTDKGVRLDDPKVTDKQKAEAFVVRNGPINILESASSVCKKIERAPEKGWFPVTSAALRKGFQIDAVAISGNKANRTVTTLEFQQDRQVDKGNKWGAWFRYDLDIFPGNLFNWNGAMHTEGNLMVDDNFFNAYLISAPSSCLYTRDASEITVTERKADSTTGQPDFLGQFIAGWVVNGSNGKDGTTRFHLYDNPPIKDPSNTNTQLKNDTDSVSSGSAAEASLDPRLLFTKDISKARDAGKVTRDGNWEKREFVKKGRLYNQFETKPYVDDTYRADDRYGPKPSYDAIQLNSSDRYNGKDIAAGDQLLLTNMTVDPLDTEYKTLGLDGYWERRAYKTGLRVIVGPRLELGNPFGWGVDLNNDGDTFDTVNNISEADPLYPSDKDSITHEAQQRRTLRDNLAAVQATAVYHQGSGKPDEPIACVATTAHPGTKETVDLSKNFEGSAEPFQRNFFIGKGTNGWEYKTPPGGLGGDWDKAIKNLANLAGEKEGAFPPTKQDRVYPHPYLSMWGNFSNLKRAIDPGNGSVADKTYKMTAACTMGILANNIYEIEQYDTSSDLNAVDDALKAIDTTKLPALVDITKFDGTDTEGFISTRTPDDFIRLFRLLPASFTDSQKKELENKARLISLNEQIKRDRWFGFAPVIPDTISKVGKNKDDYTYKVEYHDSNYTGADSKYKKAAFTFAGVNFDKKITTETATDKNSLKLGCNIKETQKNNKAYLGLGAPTNADEEEKFIRLASSLCSAKPKFPSLHYLFPKESHGKNKFGSVIDKELYIGKAPDESFSDFDLANIRLEPKTNFSDWSLPSTDSATGRPSETKINLGSASRYVSLIDNGIYDGREAMTVRVLDLDLDLLRRKDKGSFVLPDGTSVTDTLLPASGVVYAFREDAVREDGISRKDSGNTTNATKLTSLTDPTDPKIEDNGISPKPVDFHPDPDRRPHGFRLRKGADLRRAPGGTPNNRVETGLSFISDNPVYIEGNFNLHSTDGTTSNLLEEYKDGSKLKDDWDNFYDRKGDDLDDRFAQPEKDTWRPTEILADAVAILSEFDPGTKQGFYDGNIDWGIRATGDSSLDNNRHSFRGMNRPNDTDLWWIREDNSVAKTPSATLPYPIKISRNGNPFYCDSDPGAGKVCPNPKEYSIGDSKSYVGFNTASSPQSSNPKLNFINRARETSVNATIVSGIVPFQQGQTNGGFHNFPRFLENWYPSDASSGTKLRIAGSFVQLNFSTYATGPFDQDAWEPNGNNKRDPDTGNLYRSFYEAPQRVWGYDVGLQLAPAGPLAQRFVTPGVTRSEFYQELPANDAYICPLRLALNQKNSEIDNSAKEECK